MQQEIMLVTHSDRLAKDFKAVTRESKKIKIRPVDKPIKLNKVFKKRGKILDVVILDLTLRAEDLDRFIFYIKEYKKDLPVILLRIDHSISKKDGEAFRNLAVYGCIRRPSNREEAECILEDLNNILDLDMDKKIAKIEYLEKEKVFACTFKNMRTYFLKREDISETVKDDGSKITHCAVDKERYHFTVFLESGKKYMIPWDFILHMCEERYDYFKKKQVNGISSEEIGKRIRSERKMKQLRQKDLAKMTGIQRANIARIEKGRHYPSIETLEKVSEALEIPVAKLVAR